MNGLTRQGKVSGRLAQKGLPLMCAAFLGCVRYVDLPADHDSATRQSDAEATEADGLTNDGFGAGQVADALPPDARVAADGGPRFDCATVNISAPQSVTAGDSSTIDVTVQNLGSELTYCRMAYSLVRASGGAVGLGGNLTYVVQPLLTGETHVYNIAIGQQLDPGNTGRDIIGQDPSNFRLEGCATAQPNLSQAPQDEVPANDCAMSPVFTAIPR